MYACLIDFHLSLKMLYSYTSSQIYNIVSRRSWIVAARLFCVVKHIISSIFTHVRRYENAHVAGQSAKMRILDISLCIDSRSIWNECIQTSDSYQRGNRMMCLLIIRVRHTCGAWTILESPPIYHWVHNLLKLCTQKEAPRMQEVREVSFRDTAVRSEW